MKSVTAYYLLLFYCIALFKPVLPVLTNFLAHIFWQTDHITTVHQHQGKDHVHFELLDAAKDQDNKNTPVVKLSETVSVHIIVSDTHEFSYNLLLTTRPSLYNSDLAYPVIDLPVPPPKA